MLFVPRGVAKAIDDGRVGRYSAELVWHMLMNDRRALIFFWIVDGGDPRQVMVPASFGAPNIQAVRRATLILEALPTERIRFHRP